MTDSGPITDDLDLIRSAAVSAGILGAGYFRRDPQVWTKGNASPVTEADVAIDTYLYEVLTGARPDYGWISEENAARDEPVQGTRSFVVDPIDGTRGFIRGDDDWTICIAIIEERRPIAGIVYSPVRDELFDAVLGQGARLNGLPLARQPEALHEPPSIPTPGAVHKVLARSGVDYQRGPIVASLAYRLVSLASGATDAVVARRGSQDWDIAAADIILAEAGVELEDVCVGRPIYGTTELRHGGLVASAVPGLREPLREALVEIYGCPQQPTGSAHA